MLAPTPASPESAGMSKAAFDRLEEHLKHRYIDAGRFPGTQMLLYRRGKIVDSAADAHRRPAAPHLRADLRLPAIVQRRCRLPRNENRRGRKSGNAAIDDR